MQKNAIHQGTPDVSTPDSYALGALINLRMKIEIGL